jgi:magnesium transporter
MLIGTGGNAGNQSATLVIRGLATGEITRKHGLKVLFREIGIGFLMALLLVTVSVARVYAIHHDVMSAVAIGASLFLIVITAISLGTLIPLVLERLGIDPAHSAAPFLATLIDIIGMFIYCIVASKILG